MLNRIRRGVPGNKAYYEKTTWWNGGGYHISSAFSAEYMVDLLISWIMIDPRHYHEIDKITVRRVPSYEVVNLHD